MYQNKWIETKPGTFSLIKNTNNNYNKTKQKNNEKYFHKPQQKMRVISDYDLHNNELNNVYKNNQQKYNYKYINTIVPKNEGPLCLPILNNSKIIHIQKNKKINKYSFCSDEDCSGCQRMKNQLNVKTKNKSHNKSLKNKSYDKDTKSKNNIQSNYSESTKSCSCSSCKKNKHYKKSYKKYRSFTNSEDNNSDIKCDDSDCEKCY
ncbi:hypothetical protein Hokovirus_4_32 [Hokovirus HKV1]|uniref:Uncharacterized protein n=1 Tax=Hokovirus HKV1 TaxID=1977638 RepID=A0A1V0SHD6_9VIRU|nr:hypothetical protein Hokovirus_4_32 [Hokovirus HKV1]